MLWVTCRNSGSGKARPETVLLSVRLLKGEDRQAGTAKEVGVGIGLWVLVPKMLSQLCSVQ